MFVLPGVCLTCVRAVVSRNHCYLATFLHGIVCHSVCLARDADRQTSLFLYMSSDQGLAATVWIRRSSELKIHTFGPGQSCQEKCGGVNGVLPDECDVDKMLAITTSELVLLVGGCQLESVAFEPLAASNAAPYIREVQGGLSKICYYQPGKGGTQGPKQLPTCSATVPPQYSPFNKRVCVCKASTNQDSGGGSAENVGDPHIHSFRGAHYTLLQQGVFVAWNFSKAEPGAAPAEWQLLAAYGGDRFTTQALLLLDPHAGSMEMTADDCTWRIKEEKSTWRQASLGQISAEVGTTSLQVKKLHEKLGETKILKSSILLQMRSSSSGMKNVAKLFTHCVPQKHLDFKITMFDSKDVEYVGGELGVAPDANNNYHFFTKKSMVQMRADQEFKAGMTLRHFRCRHMPRIPVPQETSDCYHCFADSCGREGTIL